MKQKKQDKQVLHQNDQHEIQKAVAQAWHSYFNNAKEATSEFDLRRRNFQSKASRFKLEALNMIKYLKNDDNKEAKKVVEWNFDNSLWDSYEIVAVSKRLEVGIRLDCDFDDLHKMNAMKRMAKSKKESKNSLRNLFNMMSSRRFNHEVIQEESSS